MGGLYTGILVIAALLFFTPYFYYIPKATLAGVIIAAVIFMVEVKVVKPMWRSKSKFDPLLKTITFDFFYYMLSVSKVHLLTLATNSLINVLTHTIKGK